MSTGSPKSSPVLLEVTVRGAPRDPRPRGGGGGGGGRGGPRPPRRPAGGGGRGGLLLALAAAVAAGAVWLGVGAGSGRPDVNPLARERGPAGVAAASGHPLGCLAVSILPTDPTYARADFNHQTLCGRYAGYPTAIFHYSSGAWRAVVDAAYYTCPVRSLPTAVQTQLGVCLPSGGQPSWRVRAGLTTPGLAASRSSYRVRPSTPPARRPHRGCTQPRRDARPPGATCPA